MNDNLAQNKGIYHDSQNIDAVKCGTDGDCCEPTEKCPNEPPSDCNDIPQVPHPYLPTYLGVKLVQAEPMQKEKWDATKKFEDRGDHSLVDGYKVIYEDGYTSWSPKEVFEKAYRRIDNLTFGLAIEALKQGKKVARKGWNGKRMYLFYIGTEMHIPGLGGWTYTNGVNDNYPLLPFIAMKTADDKVVPWLASQTDMLAEDWVIVK